MADGTNSYLWGSPDEEIRRLGSQHQIWAQETDQLWKRSGFKSGQTILDLGCGPGYAALDLAQRVGPTGKVVAIDSSEKYLDHLRAVIQSQSISNIEVIQSDFAHADLSDGRFDAAYARFVMIFLKDPAEIIRKVSRALKPNGVIAITDYAAYFPHFTISPSSAAFHKVVQAIEQMVVNSGGNLHVQMGMPQVLSDCGFEVRELNPIIRIARPTDNLWNWGFPFFRWVIPSLIQQSLFTKEDSESLWADIKERTKDPNAFFITPPLIDIIAVKK